jgi:aminoglycoside phosphotransferase family enzyme/predicted kinase
MVVMSRLSCLVLTNDPTCRDTLRLAATLQGWLQREGRLAYHAATRGRPSVADDYDLMFVDLRHLVGAARRRAWEIIACAGGRPAKLVVVCGAPEDSLEERWTWELGANLYLPGTPVSAAVDCVCRHLGSAAYTSDAYHRSVSRPAMAPDADSRRLVAGLLRPEAYPHPTADIRLVETHISWVFLTGPFVYKVKKPCSLGFLDFSTLERRRQFCHEEVRLSGRFAPELYLGAVPITGSPDMPRIEGPGTPWEWAVKLVQFDEADRLDAVFEDGRLAAADCESLGAEIARVHGRLAVADPAAGFGTATSVLDAVAINLDQLRGLRPDAGARIDRIAAWLHDRLTAATDTIAARAAGGHVRECHGDLHLANIVLHDGRMMAFDAIEFSPGLRWIDVANDVAFLAMDLHVRGRPDLAAHVETAWVEAADDHAALAVLPIYEVYRAVVRADVAALRGAGPSGAPDKAAAIRAETDRYLDVAERLMQGREPVLFVTSGISGSGKTTLATRLVAAAGAVRIRSDVERKRLAGMAATDRPADAVATAALYDSALTRRVYDRLAALACTALAAGRSVVIDAACNARWQREILAALARDAGVELVWLEFAVPTETVIARVTRRAAAGTDASDASAAVVREQIAVREPITAEELTAAGGRCRLVPITPEALADAAFVTTLTRPASTVETDRCRS